MIIKVTSKWVKNMVQENISLEMETSTKVNMLTIKDKTKTVKLVWVQELIMKVVLKIISFMVGEDWQEAMEIITKVSMNMVRRVVEVCWRWVMLCTKDSSKMIWNTETVKSLIIMTRNKFTREVSKMIKKMEEEFSEARTSISKQITKKEWSMVPTTRR